MLGVYVAGRSASTSCPMASMGNKKGRPKTASNTMEMSLRIWFHSILL